MSQDIQKHLNPNCFVLLCVFAAHKWMNEFETRDTHAKVAMVMRRREQHGKLLEQKEIYANLSVCKR